MLYPPTSLLLLLHDEPAARPVYDIQPVIVRSPRWPHLQTLAARLTRTRPGSVERAPESGDVPAHT